MGIVNCWFIAKHNDEFEHSGKILKNDTLSKAHPIILASVRFLTGLTLSLLRELKYSFIAPAAIQFACLVYVISKLPYSKTAVSVRAIINEAVILVIIAVNIIYSLDVMNA